MYSLGLNYKFKPFGVKNVELGVGYAYLKASSKNEELKHTQAVEAYLSVPIYEKEKLFASHLTFDWQWMKDRLKYEENPENKGHIFGVRLNLTF
jgi:porin